MTIMWERGASVVLSDVDCKDGGQRRVKFARCRVRVGSRGSESGVMAAEWGERTYGMSVPYTVEHAGTHQCQGVPRGDRLRNGSPKSLL